MSSLSLVAFIIALFAAVGHAQNAFLQPWTAGVNKDYSENLDYAVGEIIITEWSVDYSKTTITLNQDNNPGDAQGGPSRVLERKSGFHKSCISKRGNRRLQQDDMELDSFLRRHGSFL